MYNLINKATNWKILYLNIILLLLLSIQLDANQNESCPGEIIALLTDPGGHIGVTQTICSGGDPDIFTEITPPTVTEECGLQWQFSTSDCESGFMDIPGATSTTYDVPSGLTVTTYYRRRLCYYSGGEVAQAIYVYSNCITVFVNNVYGVTIVGDQTICSEGDPGLLEPFVVGFIGDLSYQWQSSTTDCELAFMDISGATMETYDPPAGLTMTTYYRRITTSTLNDVECTHTSNCVTVTINDVTGGAISADQTICSGDDPAEIIETSPSTGDGTLSYQWQSSPCDCLECFSDISGATMPSYDPPPDLTISTYYRRVTTSTLNDVECTDISNCVVVYVNNVSGGEISASQTICSEGDPAIFTQNIASTGEGILSYQWQSSTGDCELGYMDISGATMETYDPPADLTINTYYHRVATSTLNGVECTAISNCVEVLVYYVTGGTISGDQTICSEGDPALLTETSPSTGDGTLSYQWQSSTTNCMTDFTDISGAIMDTYDPPAGLTMTTYYRRVTTSEVFSPPIVCMAISNCVIVIINNVTGGTISEDQTICNEGDPALITETSPSTGTGTLSYQWQSSPCNCGECFTDIAGENLTTYDPPAGLTIATYYRRVTTSTLNSVECTDISNCIIVDINNVTGGAISEDQTICNEGDPAMFMQTDASGSGELTYQWQSSTTDCELGFMDISGATMETYDPPAGLTINTYYHRVVTSTLNGVGCTAISNCVTVTIHEVTGGEISGDQSICSGGDPALFTETIPSTGDGTLSYQWQSSPCNCGECFSDILGATSITYDPPAGLTEITYYRRVTTSEDLVLGILCSAMSNCITVNIYESPGGTVLFGGGEICLGESIDIYFSIPGGTAPFTVVYSDGINDFTVNNYNSDDPILVSPTVTTMYSPISVTDSNGCSGNLDGNPIVTVNDLPVNTLLYGGGTICQGEYSEIFFNIPGGTAPYTVVYADGYNNYTVDDYDSDDPITVFAEETTVYYPISVTDAKGCTGDVSGIAEVFVNDAPGYSYLYGGEAICQGESSAIFFSIIGGTGPYKVVYTDGITDFTVSNYTIDDTITISPTVTTDYLPVSVTDSNGCTGFFDQYPVMVVVYESPGNTVLYGDEIICAGDSGDIFFYIPGGTAPYTVVFTDGADRITVENYNSEDPIALSPVESTDYSPLSVTDANGCEGILDGLATITVIEKMGNALLTGGGNICEGENINIFVTIPVGFGPYSVVYSNGTEEFTIDNFNSGDTISVSPLVTTDYSLVSVTDVHGCAKDLEGQAKVFVNEGIGSAILFGNRTICLGDSSVILFNIAQDKGPYTVVYSDGIDTFNVSNYFSDDPIKVKPIVTTSYFPISVFNANGCQAELSAAKEPVQISSKFLNGPASPGDTVDLQFTIQNFYENFELSEITFIDSLNKALPGLVAVDVIPAIPCGGGSSIKGTSTLIFSGGNLPSGGNCTFIVKCLVPLDASSGVYTNTTSSIIGTVNSAKVTGKAVSSDLQILTKNLLGKSIADNPAEAGSVTVKVNKLPGTSLLYGDNTICEGTETDIFFSIPGGTPPFIVSYSDKVDSFIVFDYLSDHPIKVNPVVTTIYLPISVTDAIGCTAKLNGEILINVNKGIGDALLSGDATICLGENAEFSLSIVDGTAPFDIIYSDGINEFSVNNYMNDDPIIVSPTVTTQYTPISVVDANGCIAEPSGLATVTVNEGLGNVIFSGGGFLCLEESVDLFFTIPGGVAPYTVIYSDSIDDFTVSNYSSNDPIPVSPDETTNYFPVSVTDSNGCAGALTGMVTASINELFESVSLVGDNIICSGESSDISIQITGGVPPFTVVYNDGTSDITIDNYDGEPITVNPSVTTNFTLINVTDECGNSEDMTGIITITINENPQNILLSGDNRICKGENSELTINIEDGMPPYTLVYSDGFNEFTVNNYFSNDPITVSPAETTDYSLISITDMNGCSGEPDGMAIVTVDEGPGNTMLMGGGNICMGESGDIFFTIPDGVPPYTVVYSDGTDNFTIVNYSSNDLIMVSPSETTDYFPVSVMDSNDCNGSLDGMATISIYEDIVDVSLLGDTTICIGESADISVAVVGGVLPLTIVYNDGNLDIKIEDYVGEPITVSPSQTTDYTLISVLDDCGNIANMSNSVTITINDGPEIAELQGDNTICKGEESALIFEIEGGMSPYTLIYSDGFNEFIINDYDGEAINVSPDMTSMYNLVSVTDICGETNVLTGGATVDVTELPVINLVSTDCSEDLDSYNLEITTDGVNLSSSSGTVIFNGSGSYSIFDIPAADDVILTSVTSNGLCSVELTEEPPECNCPFINAPISEGDKEICEGESIPSLSVVVDADHTADWYDTPSGGIALLNDSTGFVPSNPGDYYAEARSEINNCVSEDRTKVSLNIISIPVITISGDMEICDGQTTTILNAGSGFENYIWSNSETTQEITVAEGGDYFVTATDVNGCIGVAEFSVNLFTPPVITIIGELEICGGENTILDAGPDFSAYQWNTGSDEQTLQTSEAGVYSVTVTDINGCTAESSVLVLLIDDEIYESNFLTNKEACTGDSIHFIDISDIEGEFTSFMWDFGDGENSTERYPIHVYSSEGLYNVGLHAFRNDCQIFSGIKEVNIRDCKQNIHDSSGFSYLNVFPNPSSGKFSLRVGLLDKMDALVELYNPEGILIDSKYFFDKDYIGSFEVFNTGIYFVRIKTAFHTKTRKICITN